MDDCQYLAALLHQHCDGFGLEEAFDVLQELLFLTEGGQTSIQALLEVCELLGLAFVKRFSCVGINLILGCCLLLFLFGSLVLLLCVVSIVSCLLFVLNLFDLLPGGLNLAL